MEGEAPKEVEIATSLISHLSGEIQAELRTIDTVRGRMGLTGWIAPFLVLSAIVTAEKTSLLSNSRLSSWSLLCACLCYLGVGAMYGSIERRAWFRANALREAMLKIASNYIQVDHSAFRHDMPGPGPWSGHRWVSQVTVWILLYSLVLLAALFLGVTFIAD